MLSSILVVCLRIAALPGDGSFQLEAESETDKVESRRSPAASFDSVVNTSSETIVERGYLTLADFLDAELLLDFRPLAWLDTPATNGIAGSVNYMIDGVSVTNPQDYRFSARLASFPEEFDAVEVTRGPAGVTWGSFSLLGTVNLISSSAQSRQSRETRLSLGLGNQLRLASKQNLAVGPGRLSLFVGYASYRVLPSDYTYDTTSLLPYGLSWRTSDPRDVVASPNTAALVSANYKSGPWTVYFRAPTARTSYDVSEYGSAMRSGAPATREQTDVFGYVSYARAWLNGQLSALGRISYFRTRDSSRRELVAASTEIPAGAAYWLRADIGRTEVVSEWTLALPVGAVSSETLAGVNGQYEQIYTSDFSLALPETTARTWLSLGSAYRPGSIASASIYGFERLKLWDRLALGGGVRHYFGGNAFKSLTLAQFNIALRLEGQAVVSVGYLQGMRPPQLPDRQGRRPVIGQDLKAERSDAIQLDIKSGTFSIGPFAAIDLGLNLLRSTTADNIQRQTLTVGPYRELPSNATGYTISSLNGYGRFVPRSLPIAVRGAYRYNLVRDTRSLSSDEADRRDAVLTNPSCGTDSCANKGPAHRALVALELPISKATYAYVSSLFDCGGTWRVADPRENAGIPNVTPRDELKSEGCYKRLSFGATLRAIGPLSVSVTAQNITDEKVPVMLYDIGELGLAEAGVYANLGRTIFASVSYREDDAQAW